MNSDVFSAQYAENSTRDWVDRINAGAVSDERSPLNDAIDWEQLASVRITQEKM
jgi:hypothetical protein